MSSHPLDRQNAETATQSMLETRPPSPGSAPNRLMKGPQAWFGPDLAARPEEWLVELSPKHIEALLAATRYAVARGTDVSTITQADFPIEAIAEDVADWRRQCLHERGFIVLRGLPVAEMSTLEAGACFYGLGTHLGLAVSQNGKGHVLGHVKDLGLDYNLSTTRGYQTAARLPYHTDYADLVALLCLQTAATGGQSSIVSSVTMYNRMLELRPDLVDVLRQPLYRTRWGEVSSELPAWIEMPAFNVHAEGVMTTYVRSAVRKAQRIPEVPRLSDAQVEAMDLFDALACDPELHLDMSFEQGDIQIVNNHWLLHSRTAYEEHPEPERKRHLLRLWLACDDGPPFPLAMTESFQGLTLNGRPNGIHVPGVPFNAPLEAC